MYYRFLKHKSKSGECVVCLFHFDQIRCNSDVRASRGHKLSSEELIWSHGPLDFVQDVASLFPIETGFTAHT